ncbi:hypothetical protein FA13DRAFT_1730096 [Coprinellus micaceus]|uniref:DUF1996 domain-containing protein n=1 Tax=Coprinellus micaceus TaxID=71717 RepID=A0A4Y7TI23_COPMI|nr:hypothetical protein FA13DRAFT_1730096 [Coprinellus micaceus]
MPRVLRVPTLWQFVILFNLGVNIARCYWLMGANNVLTTQRIDPIVNPGIVGPHVHDILGGSNFGFNLSTERLRQSECTSIPISEDKSSYWYPRLYFWWRNGSFTSVVGNPVIYYLYANEPGVTTAFPDDFRMISGDPTVRTFDPSNFAQQAVTYICLDFEGTSAKFNELPVRRCPSGIRSQINFPSCWNGRDVDSLDHKSHVSFLSTGPDNGTCSSSEYPVTLPRIFLEVYWYTQEFDPVRNKAMVPRQPFVFSNGDPVGLSWHADFYNGWDSGVLQKALNECNCNPYGDPACCVAKGLFTMDRDKKCFVTDRIVEQTSGTLAALPGPNPVQERCFEDFSSTERVVPALLDPVYVHNGSSSALPSATVSTPSTTMKPPAKGYKAPKGTCISNSNASAGEWPPPSRFAAAVGFVIVVFFVL